MSKIIVLLVFCFSITFAGRYYDADVGFFISTDPSAQFFNAYGYGYGNPLNGTDPNGNDWYDFGEGDIQWREGSGQQELSGFGNAMARFFGTGGYATHLGAEVLVIQGVENNEQVNQATFLVYTPANLEGPTAVAFGSSLPAPGMGYNTLAEGLYTNTFLIPNYHGSGIAAIGLAGQVPSTSPMINMTLVRVHRGNTVNNAGLIGNNGVAWSAGCPTFGYGAGTYNSAQAFGTNFTNGMNVYLQRY